jgi:glutamyl-tRNA synthetase
MIRTRFSPSPTGLIHLGNARAALFSALFASHSNGAFLLRIEDTDAARSEQRYTELLQSDLHWLSIDWKEGPGVGGPNGPYWQSQRHEIYDTYYKKLETEELAYPCFCSDQELALNRKIQLSRGQAPRYPGTCLKLSKEDVAKKIADGLKPALRFKIPVNKMIEFVDLVKGPQKFNSDDIGDFIIRRADGSSSFMFCNAIDDSLMGVTHVLRGEDHLANTPRQLMILQALGMRHAEYGHLSLITGDDGTPLSKRHGSSSLHDLREQGFLPQAVLNYMARLSHAYEEHKLMSFAELAAQFHLEKISRAPARFDNNQLLHWQKEAVLAMDQLAMWEWLGESFKQQIPIAAQEQFIELMRQNILFPAEAHKWANILFGDKLEFLKHQTQIFKEAGEEFFKTAIAAIKAHPGDLKALLNELKTTLNISGKKLFLPVRMVLTGEEHGPELAQIAALLGPEKVLKRFEDAASTR